MLLFLRRPPRLPPPSRPPASSRFLSNVFFPGRFWIVNSRDRCRTLYPVEQSINAPVTPDSYNYWREDMRQVRYAFDPAQLPDPPEYAQLAFLEPETKPNSPDLEHANPVHPPVMGVPWPTTFSHSLQAKGWFFTEGDLRRFIRETFFRDERVDHRRPREYAEHVVDSAMSFVANVFPTSLPKRLNMLARMYAVVFMHDDRVDLGNIPPDGRPENGFDSEGELSIRAFSEVSGDMLLESPALGSKALDSFRNWASTRSVRDPSTFEKFEDYILHRVEHVGVDIEFASDIQLYDDELQLLQPFMVDCARHFTLTHDLYSYASVAQDEKAPNVVHALQALAGQSPESAKASVRQAIWDTERQIYDRYADLVAQYDDSDVLVRYSQRLIIALAGNVFYSATSPRYGQYVEGAQVPENQDFFDEL